MENTAGSVKVGILDTENLEHTLYFVQAAVADSAIALASPARKVLQLVVTSQSAALDTERSRTEYQMEWHMA
jgi:hypothetical protein